MSDFLAQTKATLLILLLAPAGLGFADWTITHRLPFDPNMREPEFEWLESDPNLYVSLFETYRQFEGRPYLWLIAEHWLEYNPILKRSAPIGGRAGFVAGRGFQGRGTDIPPLCLGNLNGDDAIDLGDFAIAAAYPEAWRHGTSEGLSKGAGMAITYAANITVKDVATRRVRVAVTRTDDVAQTSDTFVLEDALIATPEQENAAYTAIRNMIEAMAAKDSAVATVVADLENKLTTALTNWEATRG
jgi:hypothetical protein